MNAKRGLSQIFGSRVCLNNAVHILIFSSFKSQVFWNKRALRRPIKVAGIRSQVSQLFLISPISIQDKSQYVYVAYVYRRYCSKYVCDSVSERWNPITKIVQMVLPPNVNKEEYSHSFFPPNCTTFQLLDMSRTLVKRPETSQPLKHPSAFGEVSQGLWRCSRGEVLGGHGEWSHHLLKLVQCQARTNFLQSLGSHYRQGVLLEQWRSFAGFVLDKTYVNSISKLELLK